MAISEPEKRRAAAIARAGVAAEPYTPPSHRRLTKRLSHAIAVESEADGRRATIRELAELHARTLEAEARAERQQLREAVRRAARWQALADRYPDDRLLIHASLREVA